MLTIPNRIRLPVTRTRPPYELQVDLPTASGGAISNVISLFAGMAIDPSGVVPDSRDHEPSGVADRPSGGAVAEPPPDPFRPPPGNAQLDSALAIAARTSANETRTVISPSVRRRALRASPLSRVIGAPAPPSSKAIAVRVTCL